MSIEHGFEISSGYRDPQQMVDCRSWVGGEGDRYIPTKTFHYDADKPEVVTLGGDQDSDVNREIAPLPGRRIIVAPENMATVQVIDVVSAPRFRTPGRIVVTDLLEERTGFMVVNQQVHDYDRGMSGEIAIPEGGLVKVIDAAAGTVEDEAAWQTAIMYGLNPRQNAEFQLADGVQEAIGSVVARA